MGPDDVPFISRRVEWEHDSDGSASKPATTHSVLLLGFEVGRRGCKESNRDQARHIGVKLRGIDCALVAEGLGRKGFRVLIRKGRSSPSMNLTCWDGRRDQQRVSISMPVGKDDGRSQAAGRGGEMAQVSREAQIPPTAVMARRRPCRRE
jgi:hypothetical protein